MNKETLAEDYSLLKYPQIEVIKNDVPFITVGDLFDECKENFIAGYEAAEQQAGEFAIGFAEWANESHANATMFQIGSKEIKQQMFLKYKQSLKQ